MASPRTDAQARERDLLLAHFYDLEYAGYEDDIDFYVQMAQVLDLGQEGTILELGCGTGRIAIALAKEGYRVVGVDRSNGMLDIFRRRAADEGVGDRISAVNADMRLLEGLPSGRFSLAYCALNTFAYLTSSDDQLAALRVVRALVEPGGALLLDLTPPWPHLLPPSDGEVVHQATFTDSDGTLVHKFVTARAEPGEHLHHVILLYDREGADGTLRRTSQALTLRWSSWFQVDYLLRTSGWKLQRLYGSYDLDEFNSESERMIFVARA